MLSPGADGGDGWERAGRIGGIQKRFRLAQSRPAIVLSAGLVTGAQRRATTRVDAGLAPVPRQDRKVIQEGRRQHREMAEA
jgi:hypothetical protein